MATGIRKPAHSSAASPAVSGGATFNRRGGIYCRPPYDVGGDKPLPYSGNIDATHSNTAPSWTNHPRALRPVESQQVQTNSATQFINVADEISSSRRTYNPTNSAAGDTEAIAAKGRLVLINGAVPTVQTQTGVYPSELFSHRNPTYNENTIAVSSDRGALEISGANLMYEGTRVKTWIVGRDLNPGGRGLGEHYPNGMFSIGSLRPMAAGDAPGGFGNSVNNPGMGPGGGNAPCNGGSCGQGYVGSPLACCCLDTEDKFKKCACGSGCCCPEAKVDLCIGCVAPSRPYGMTHVQALANDPTYRQEYCNYRRCLYECYRMQLMPYCSPMVAWECCKDFCDSLSGGGGNNSIQDFCGCGCEVCQGEAALSRYRPSSIDASGIFLPSARSGLKALTDMASRCLGCMVANKLGGVVPQIHSDMPGNAPFNVSLNCLFNLFGSNMRYVDEATNCARYGGLYRIQCCFGANPQTTGNCCTTTYSGGVTRIIPAVSCLVGDAYGMNAIRQSYTLLCNYFWSEHWCDQVADLVHEMIHQCYPGKGHDKGYTEGEYIRASQRIVSCCYSECATRWRITNNVPSKCY